MNTTKKNSVTSSSQEDKLQAIWEQNSLIQAELAKLTRKVSRYLLLARISAVVWLLLVLGPIIAGIIFLPPLFKDLMASYQSVLPLDAKTFNSLGLPSLR